MSIWAGIKHALNSTLGTSDFQPLDKLLKDEIVNQTQMVATDDIHMTLDDFIGYINKGDAPKMIYDTQILKCTRNGSIKIKGTLKASANLRGGFLYVEKNGVNVYVSTKVSNLESLDFSTDIIFIKAGDVIKFNMLLETYSTGADAARSLSASLNICGKIQQSAFDIV